MKEDLCLLLLATMASLSLVSSLASLPSPQRQLNDTSDVAAEHRLREAIEELQRRRKRPPCDHGDDQSCVSNAIGDLCQSFLLSYGLGVGIGILLRAFKLARRKSSISRFLPL